MQAHNAYKSVLSARVCGELYWLSCVGVDGGSYIVVCSDENKMQFSAMQGMNRN